MNSTHLTDEKAQRARAIYSGRIGRGLWFLCLWMATSLPLPAQQLSLGISVSGSNVTVTMYGPPGQQVTLQSATSVQGFWSAVLSTNLPATPAEYVTAVMPPFRAFRMQSTGFSAVYSVNVVAYMTLNIPAGGGDFVANQLRQLTNTAGAVFPLLPDGISLFKAGESGWVANNFLGGWLESEMPLRPGEGFFVRNPRASAVMLTMVGEIPQGTLTVGLPAGTALAASMVPQSGLLQTTLGFPAADGDFILIYRIGTGFEGYTYFGDFFWDPFEPTLAVGQSFWVSKSIPANWVRNFSINFAGGGFASAGGPFTLPAIPNVSTGQVNFFTYHPNTALGRVFDLDGVTPVGSALKGQLYAATSASEGSLTPIGNPVAFLAGAGAGYINSGTVLIPGTSDGATVYYQLRVWESARGASYELATANGSKFGKSAIVSAITGGGIIPPPNANGFASFNLSGPPSITTQPQSQTVISGSDVNFSVTASGSAPLRYRWLFNGTNIVSAATNATFLLSNVQPANAGSYSVIVTNAFGAVTSSIASLTIQVPVQVALSPVADTSLFEFTPDNNLGAVPSLVSGTTQTPTRSRALVKFDVASAIPSNAQIVSAKLTLKVVRVPGDGAQASTFELRRLSRSWGEGTKAGSSSGALATAGEATWKARFHPDSLWSSNGASAPTDYANAIDSVRLVNTLGSYDFTNLSATVQFWLTNAAANFGWILISQSEGTASTARRFGSREDPPNAPRLEVIYVVPAAQPPTIFCLGGDPGPASGGGVDRFYDDGYVRVDSGGNTGCHTWFWGYVSASQVPGDGYIYFHARCLSNSVYLEITDRYALNGLIPPGPPHNGTFGGPGPLLSDAPERNTTVGSCLPSPSGLLAWWPGDGNANNIVGTNQGTLVNGATFGTGRVSAAFRFDGLDDYVRLPDSPLWNLSTNDFTIQMWTRLDQIKDTMFVHQQSGTGPGGFEFYSRNTGGLVFALSSTVAADSGNWTPQTNVWYHLAVTRSNHFFRIYVDGAQLTNSGHLNTNPVADVSGVVRLGSYAAGGYELAGMLDEVSVHNRALSATELAAVHAMGSAGMCKTLLVVLINGQFYPSNSVTISGTNPVSIQMQSTFAGGTILYSLDGSPPADGAFYNGPFTLGASTIIRAIAYSSDFTQSAETGPLILTVQLAPAIQLQPGSQTVVLGSDVLFSVSVSGTEPFSYQWYFNGSPIVGASGASFSRSNAQLADAGNYQVVVSNAYGAVVSAEAMLIVLAPPGFVVQPVNQTVQVGQNFTNCVMATGTPPLFYQWRKNGVNIPGATNNCFMITNVQAADGGIYNVVVANAAGAASSDESTLTVSNVPQAPGNGTVTGCAAFTYRLVVTGPSVPGASASCGIVGGTARWLAWIPDCSGIATVRTAGSSFDTVLSVFTGSNILTLQMVTCNDDGGDSHTSEVRFNAVANTRYLFAVDGFAGSTGQVVLSLTIEPTLEALPTITAQPASQIVTNGTSVSFTVAATGSGLTYQWYLNGNPILGSTNSTLSVMNVSPSTVGSYTVRVRNSAGRIVESEPAVLELGQPTHTFSRDKLEDLYSSGPPGFSTPEGSVASGFLSVSMGTIDSQTFNNIGATGQQREPSPCGDIGGSSKWFGLRPEVDGLMQIDTIGSSFDTLLAIYTGTNNVQTLTNVACNNNGAPSGASVVQLPAKRGTNYSIAVDGVMGAQGTIVLNWRLGAKPTFIASTQTVQNARLGDTLLLQANAGSTTADLTYQWFLDTQLLTGAATRELLLTNLQPAQAGTYRVVARNFAGSVTGTVATISVATPVQLAAGLVISNGTHIFRLSGGAGRAYVIEASSNLSQWLPVHTNAATFGPLQYFEAIPPASQRRFYRVLPWP